MHFMMSNFFLENRAVYEIFRKYCKTVQVTETIWRIACSVTNATNTHSYAILTAFPLQQWLHEIAPMLRVYVYCLNVVYKFLIHIPLFKDYILSFTLVSTRRYYAVLFP
jgi:hypothetical protein